MSSLFHHLLLLISLFFNLPSPSSSTSSALVGVNYGLVANNLPPPSSVPPLLKSIGVGRVKLYNPDPTVLKSFANTGIEFIIGLPDQCLSSAASSSSFSLRWIQANVQCYLPSTKIAAITVGNEVLTNTNDTSLAQYLLPAMQSLHSALVSLNLDKQVTVTTTHSVAILASSYPPSAGRFKPNLIPYLCPILAFHAQTRSPFLINAYPFFAYKSDTANISLDYVLFEPNPGVLDTGSGLKYDNMLFAQIDAVYSAIKAAGGGGAKAVEVRVSETGWPSAGDEDELGATPENAAKYNGNLIRLIMENKGTPMVPGSPVRVYVFALFNENMKQGPASERNYGLFKPDGTPAYHLDINVPQENSTDGGGGGGGGGGYGNSTGGNPSPDYYSVSAASSVSARDCFN